MLMIYRELFGTSEEDTEDLDHTEDGDNGRFPKVFGRTVAYK